MPEHKIIIFKNENKIFKIIVDNGINIWYNTIKDIGNKQQI